MDDQDHIAAHPKLLEQGVEELAVARESVPLWIARGELVRVAHADQVRDDAPAQALEGGEHGAP